MDIAQIIALIVPLVGIGAVVEHYVRKRRRRYVGGNS